MKHPWRCIWGQSSVYTIADINGIFCWNFEGALEFDLETVRSYYEPVTEKNRVDRDGTKPPCWPTELLQMWMEQTEEMPSKPKMYTYKEAWKLAHQNLTLHNTDLKGDLFDYYS